MERQDNRIDAPTNGRRVRGPSFKPLRRAVKVPVWGDLGIRLGLALFLISTVVLIHYWDRDGLVDNLDGEVSFLDVVYFTMISITTTIETGFGSRLMVGGFLLNNELTDFSFAPMHDGKPIANRVEGGKRPRSSMAPTIVLKDGKPILLTGSPGGSRIIAYVAQSLIAMLDWRMDPQAAIDLGHVVNRGATTELEEGSNAADLADALTVMGHEVTIRNLNSGLHVIRINADGLTGAADKRREGQVLGD